MPLTLHDILESHRTRRPVVMGILNVTPDSFSDGGRFIDPAVAVEHARRMVADGADMGTRSAGTTPHAIAFDGAAMWVANSGTGGSGSILKF